MKKISGGTLQSAWSRVPSLQTRADLGVFVHQPLTQSSDPRCAQREALRVPPCSLLTREKLC